MAMHPHCTPATKLLQGFGKNAQVVRPADFLADIDESPDDRLHGGRADPVGHPVLRLQHPTPAQRAELRQLRARIEDQSRERDTTPNL